MKINITFNDIDIDCGDGFTTLFNFNNEGTVDRSDDNYVSVSRKDQKRSTYRVYFKIETKYIEVKVCLSATDLCECCDQQYIKQANDPENKVFGEIHRIVSRAEPFLKRVNFLSRQVEASRIASPMSQIMLVDKETINMLVKLVTSSINQYYWIDSSINQYNLIELIQAVEAESYELGHENGEESIRVGIRKIFGISE